eukprot:SAG22_NODE_21060_length_260_cov_0.900621_1_plen_45_part_01
MADDQTLFKYIAEVSCMIRAAEPLLWPAKPVRSELGIVYPRSSFF